jgi:homoserine kinase
MKIQVNVPATTANLGPGFDALGLALDLWNEATFEMNPPGGTGFHVTVEGEGAQELPRNQENSIVQAALQVFTRAGEACDGFRLHCLNRIPLGSGLGSSSAAVLAGMLGANALLGTRFTDEELLTFAIEAEGHPDNVAPAMLGGLVASIVDEGRALPVKLVFFNDSRPFHITIALPDFDFPTKQARAILPKTVDRSDAIYNIGRAVMVTEALRSGNLTLLGQAMRDRLHQPQRLKLIPGAQEATQAARSAGAEAVALSGAGPSLIAFTSTRNADVGIKMTQAFQSAGLTARIFELSASDEGAKVNIV